MLIALLWTQGASAGGDGPEISHSRGKKDGVVVLAPRIVPSTPDRTVDGQAADLQRRVAEAAIAAYGAPYVDIRPSPERVCPTAGCRSVSIGIMVGHQGGGCVALAIVGPPGAVDQTLVPLAGRFEMAGDVLPFRAAPESKVIVREFVPCAELGQALTPEKLASLVPPRSPAP